jgi:chemotaxis signal transduction protein
LFSLRQVLDILKEQVVFSLPFAPAHVEGITDWRNQVLPVISLEACFGLAAAPRHTGDRWIVLRTAAGPDNREEMRSLVIRSGPSMQMVSLPLQTQPAGDAETISQHPAARAVFLWEGGVLVAAHIDRIAAGDKTIFEAEFTSRLPDAAGGGRAAVDI